MGIVADRLRFAMELRKMKQADLVQRTGIGKSSISTYLSGEYEPKQINTYKLAEALDVNPSWLLGNNVPMELDKSKPEYHDILYVSMPSGDSTTDELRKYLHDIIDQLGDDDLRFLKDMTIRIRRT